MEWFLERFAPRGEAAAFIWADQAYSYAWLAREIDDWGLRLSQAGISPGQVVAVHGDYSPSLSALLLALMANRNIIVPIASASMENQATFSALAQAEVAIAFAPDDTWQVVPGSGQAVTHELLLALRQGGRPGLVLFSSGSTGKSKGIVHDLGLMLEKFRLPRPAWRTIAFLLLDHIGGMNTLLHTLANGGTLITPAGAGASGAGPGAPGTQAGAGAPGAWAGAGPGAAPALGAPPPTAPALGAPPPTAPALGAPPPTAPAPGALPLRTGRSPAEVCAAIARHRADLLPASPTFLNLLLISEAYRQYDLSSLKLITYGTEVMPETVLRRLAAALPGVTLAQTYGLSELGILRAKSRSSDSLWVKVGGEGVETKVVDGVLWVRTRSAMLGYLNAPSPFDGDGWFCTGDRVEQDGEYLRILGRESDWINVGGAKVYPAEVESVLLEMEGVLDATVYGERHPLTGQIVAARVVLAAPEDAVSLKRRVREHCRGRLEGYKVPVKITVTEGPEHNARFKKVRPR